MVVADPSFVYMLGAKYGCGPSEDFVAQTADSRFTQVSADSTHKVWIDSHKLHKPWTSIKAWIQEYICASTVS